MTENYDVPGAQDELLEPEESLDSDEIGDRANDDGYDPADRLSAPERFGTTFTEQNDGETLDQLLDEEEPDIDPYAEAERSESGAVLEADVADTHLARPGDDLFETDGGRGDATTPLVEQDEGAHPDVTSELVGREGGGYVDGESAEEDAVRLDPDS